MMVQQLLAEPTSENADSIAVIHNETQTSYKEIDLRSDALAKFLQDKWKVGRGQRICVMYENCLEYIISYFGILKTGATVVSLNSAEKPDKICGMIGHSDARGLIGSQLIWKKTAKGAEIPGTLDFAMDYRESIYLRDNGTEREDALDIPSGGIPVDPHGIDLDLAEIVYTSGSTSNPKGVMLTHLNLTSNMVSIQDYFRLSDDDRILVVLPLSYIYGKSLFLTHFMVGGTVIIDNSFTYPAVVLETMVREKATGFAGVPSTYSILMSKTSMTETSLPHLRYVAQAGGSMAPALQKEVVSAIAPARLFVMYGATEAAPRLTWLPPEKLAEKYGSIGIPLLNVEMGIRSPDGELLPENVEGELVARGSNIMKGYWKDPENSARVLVDGYYLTGDIGYRDEEGFYFITGRKSDFVKVKGFRISCKEVEECLLEIKEVNETAVIGIADPLLGEAIKAYIIPQPADENAFIESVSRHINKRIGANKIPQHWVFRETLPKNSSGKIMKEKLKKEAK